MNRCESCGMPIDDGTYCQYCVDDSGDLQAFEERFERMLQWAKKENSELSLAQATLKTKAYMRTMPAWKDHPKLVE